MKFLYICVVAVIMGVAQVQCDMKEDMHKLSQACVTESHATDEEITNYFKNGMKDEDAKDNVKCHMKCMMEKQGHLKNGAVDEEAVKKTLQSIPALKDHQDEINKAIADCKSKKGANDCDTAYQITKCMAAHKSAM
uniref:Odorant-binding protein 4 n=1 Tax=Delia platura TaxID=81723 RepID=A0A0P0UW28_9MUSC|nr:odorant-binding protein 4 [Delia platura]